MIDRQQQQQQINDDNVGEWFSLSLSFFFPLLLPCRILMMVSQKRRNSEWKKSSFEGREVINIKIPNDSLKNHRELIDITTILQARKW